MSKIDILRNDFLDSNVDVLCVTKSWMHEFIGDNFVNIDGYHLYRNDRSYSRGGGTCINNRLKFTKNVEVVSNKDVELQSITLLGNNCNERCKKINLVVVYRPPNGNYKSGREQITKFCDALPDNVRAELVILGDLNWDVSDRDGPGYKIVKEVEDLLGVEQLITCPTRVTIHTQTIIDLIFSNLSNLSASGCLTMS